ncbi:hypothetical protein IPC276_31195 [Pseudomonas aeruginosa]|nr:hypothetical protein IPC276_31195 [Pseudomonas aeruginosa]
MEEALCEPFRLNLKLASDKNAIDFRQVLDQPGTFTLWQDGRPARYVHGIVSHFTQGSSGFRRTRYELLLAALTSGERLTKVEIQWYRTSAAGTQEHYYTTVLEDAIIVDIKDYMHNCQDPGNAHFTHLEDVHFTYRKITWTHEVSGTSGSDDWRSPVAG